MFKEVRRTERKLSSDKALEILDKGEYVILSTFGENGYPYGVPVNYVLYNDIIYFHCALKGHKLENINFNSKVSFCVVTNAKVQPEKFISDYESMIVFGKAEEAIGEEKETAMIKFVRKFCKDNLQEALEHVNQFYKAVKVIKINIDHISGKSYL